MVVVAGKAERPHAADGAAVATPVEAAPAAPALREIERFQVAPRKFSERVHDVHQCGRASPPT